MQKITKILQKNQLVTGLFAIALIALMFSFALAKPQRADAQPDQFCRTSSPSTGSSTPTFLTPGGTVATTTVYASAGCSNSVYGTKSYSLGVQFIASSSVSVLKIQQEFAQSPGLGVDCIATPNACDWYAGSYSTMNGYSTTSPLSLIDMTVVPTYSWDFASSTNGGVPVTTGMLGPIGGNNRDAKLLTFPAPTQYSRWIISLATIANGNGAVFLDVIGKKEIGER